MAIVNFTIPQTLEKRVSTVMKTKGFSSKAEFFRFAAMYFMDAVHQPTINEDARFALLAQTLREELHTRYQHKKIPSLDEQLADL